MLMTFYIFKNHDIRRARTQIRKLRMTEFHFIYHENASWKPIQNIKLITLAYKLNKNAFLYFGMRVFSSTLYWTCNLGKMGNKLKIPPLKAGSPVIKPQIPYFTN